MPRAHHWPFVLAGVVIAALSVLATMQIGWIRSVNETREHRERSELEGAARRFGKEIDMRLGELVSSFEVHDLGGPELDARYERWRQEATDPRFLGAIFILARESDGRPALLRFDPQRHELARADWPPQLAAIHAEMLQGGVPLGPDPDVPAVIIPLSRPLPPERPRTAIVLQVDTAYLSRVLMPELARRYFAAGGYDVAAAHGAQIVFRSDPAWPASAAAADPDVVAPLFDLRRREREEPGSRMERPPLAAPWRLLVRHRGVPLAAVYAASRRRETAAASLVLLLLAGVAVTLALAARRAERLRRQQLEFVAGITHELNTPLAALGAAGQNLADGIAGDTARYGEAIVKETRRLIDLVDQILRFGGMEGGAPRERAASMPRAAIDEALAQCRWMAQERGVAIECEGGEELPAVRGDAASVTRAVQNLVANAVRHGGEGGWVGVRAGRENGFVEITVEDRGPGIAPADLPHLFEPFYRGRNAQTRGSGIGLTIVDRIARANGGSVRVARGRARGAAFTLRLPVAGERP